MRPNICVRLLVVGKLTQQQAHPLTTTAPPHLSICYLCTLLPAAAQVAAAAVAYTRAGYSYSLNFWEITQADRFHIVCTAAVGGTHQPTSTTMYSAVVVLSAMGLSPRAKAFLLPPLLLPMGRVRSPEGKVKKKRENRQGPFFSFSSRMPYDEVSPQNTACWGQMKTQSAGSADRPSGINQTNKKQTGPPCRCRIVRDDQKQQTAA